MVDVPKGIIVPVVTPLYADGSVDEDSLDKLINYIIESVPDNRLSGLFASSSTGEYPSFSREEANHLLEVIVDVNQGRKTIYMGVGSCSTGESLQRIEDAKGIGADYAVVVQPYYFNLSQEALYHHYETLAKQTKLPVVLYNYPPCGPTLSVDSVARLATFDTVVAMKDSSCNPNYLDSLLALNTLPILQGDDTHLFDALTSGAVGGVNGGSNVFPRLYADLYGAFLEGNLERARHLQEEITTKLRRLTSTSFPVSGLKVALTHLGILEGAYMKRPQPDATEEETKSIIEFMRSLE